MVTFAMKRKNGGGRARLDNEAGTTYLLMRAYYPRYLADHTHNFDTPIPQLHTDFISLG